MYVILLVIVCTSIIVFFSQEWANFFKNLFARSWIKLLLPLFTASLLVEYYEEWVLWLLLVFKDVLHYIFYKIADLFPFKYAPPIIHIIYLFFITTLPMLISYAYSKWKKRPKLWACTPFLCLMVFTFSAVTLTVYHP